MHSVVQVNKQIDEYNNKSNMSQRAEEILERLNSLDEDIKIEAKLCEAKADRSVMESICAFANEPGLGGGEIILGIRVDDGDEAGTKRRYAVAGVTDADSVQHDIASGCASMFNQAVRPQMAVERVDGRNVVIIRVDELDQNAKPLYFKNEGLPRGAYRRIGATDQRCTEDDLPVFYASADGQDKIVVDDTSMDDVDETALRRYRELRAVANSHAEELTYNDSDLLTALGACKKDKEGEWRLTYTGLLVFGKSMAQRRLIPAVRVDYIRVSGNKWISDADKRFDTIDMRGPLILLLSRVYNAIVDDLPHSFELENGELQSARVTKLPEKVLREAIVNALIHRTYRVNRPIQIIRYSNRIEIVNPGFSLKPDDTLGEPGSVLRNPFISSIFHETNLAETKGSGIGVMRKLMEEAGMMPPTYESDHTRNQFTIRLLLHHLLDERDIDWLARFHNYRLNESQKLALVFVRELGAVDNLSYRQLCGIDRVKASRELKKLCDEGLLTVKGKSNASYYVASENLNEMIGGMADDKGGMVDAKGGMPAELEKKVSQLGSRVSREQMFCLVEALCEWRPMNISEIAQIIQRSEKYVKDKIVYPLKQANRIAFTIPDMIKHPNQKYKKVVKKGGD